MIKRVMFLIFSLAVLVGMGLFTTAAIADDGLYGQMRWRWEGWKNALDANSDGDDSFGYNFLRTRLGYSHDIGEKGMFNMSIENTRVMGYDAFLGMYPEGPYTKADVAPWYVQAQDRMIVHEAYMGISDFLFEGFDAYAGRFSLSYGRERVIGPNDWVFYAENRFDGFKGHYTFEKGWLDLMCLKLWENFAQKYDYYDGEGEGDFDMRGLYAHFDAQEGFYVEPYILWLTQDNWNDTEDEEAWDGVELKNDSFFVFGALVDYMSDMGLHLYGEALIESGTLHDLDWDEGEVVTDDVDISGLGAYVGAFYEFDSTVKPYLGVEFNYASGTSMDDYNDNKWKTFRSPFGSYGSYMGVMNMVDWANTASFRFAGGLTPREGTDLKLDFYMFKLANEEDYAYGNYNLYRYPYGSMMMDSEAFYMDGDSWDGEKYDKSVGTEIDFCVKHQIDEGVSLNGGVAMFSFGDFFKDPEGDDEGWDSIMFGWLGGQVEF